jgi:hypothetical protein
MADRRTVADKIRAFVFQPWRAWAAGAVAKAPAERTAFEQGWAEADRASRDSRLFDLAEVLVLAGLAAAAGIAAASAGWSGFALVAVAVLAGGVGWFLVPTLWALCAAVRAPVEQRNEARVQVVIEREAATAKERELRAQHEALEHELTNARAETAKQVEEVQRRNTAEYRALQRSTNIQLLSHRLALADAQHGPRVRGAIDQVPEGDLTDVRTHAPHAALNALQNWISDVSTILLQGGRSDLVRVELLNARWHNPAGRHRPGSCPACGAYIGINDRTGYRDGALYHLRCFPHGPM